MNKWEEAQARVIAENIAAVKREIEQAEQAAKAKPNLLRAEKDHFIRLLTRARLKKKLSQARLAAMVGMPHNQP